MLVDNKDGSLTFIISPHRTTAPEIEEFCRENIKERPGTDYEVGLRTGYENIIDMIEKRDWEISEVIRKAKRL